MRRGIARLTLGLGSTALLAAATACSSSSSSPSTATSSAASSTAPGSASASGTASASASTGALSGSCGTIPNLGYTDKSGLVAGLGSYAANYNGYNGTIYASPWKTWKGKTSGVKIGILMDGLGNPFQTELESTLTATLKAYGYSTTALAPSTASITNQLQAYQTLLNDGVDMIILQAQSPTAYNSLIDKAAKQGIPTVGVLNEVEDANVVNVVPNSVLANMQVAQYMVKQAQGKGTFLFLHGIPGVPIDTDALNGTKDVTKLCPQITVNDSLVTQFDPSVAKQVLLSYLNTHPTPVSGVFTAGPFSAGAFQAFQQAGKTVPIISNNGLDVGGLAYWIQHESSYNGVALVNTPNGLGTAVTTVVHKMLNGDGVKINTLSIAPPVVTSTELSKYVTIDPSWTLTSVGTASGPASMYVTGSFIDAIFSK
jgi:ABC-type sugar transport system substrate-binding protein